MDIIETLTRKLNDYGRNESDNVVTRSEQLITTPMHLLNTLTDVGRVLETDNEEGIYVVSVRAGILNLNTAIITVKYDDGVLNMSGYAPEGIIKQNTCEKAMRKVIEGLR